MASILSRRRRKRRMRERARARNGRWRRERIDFRRPINAASTVNAHEESDHHEPVLEYPHTRLCVASSYGKKGPMVAVVTWHDPISGVAQAALPLETAKRLAEALRHHTERLAGPDAFCGCGKPADSLYYGPDNDDLPPVCNLCFKAMLRCGDAPSVRDPLDY